VARIDFLGTGNAFAPDGRLHACLSIDNNILIDTPPTIIAQLRRRGIDTSSIRHILITHWHGDHTFGMPFILLDRKYITDPNSDGDLTVYLRPGGEDFFSKLSNMAFPGSLDDSLKNSIEWKTEESGRLKDTGWTYERFPVCHTPETDPNGYELIHESGFRLLHCGDSGPCEEIEKRSYRADVVILEMGVPDIGEFPYHHRPSDVVSFVQRHPDIKVLVTHNYASAKGVKSGFRMAELPESVRQLEDGDWLQVNQDGSFYVN
tara:strand:+ start:762 stop:1547 length:786 start_codon:yes stop_codon:yes gene_type:complete